MPSKKTAKERQEYWAESKSRHGTHSGWTTHLYLGERPCEACRKARAEYDAVRKSDDRHRKNALFNARVQGKAKTALVRRHLEEYRELYAQIKAEMWADFYGNGDQP